MKKKFDRVQFAIHAFFGAVLGMMIGFPIGYFLRVFIDVPMELIVGGSALCYALVAGFKGDDFWLQLRR